MVRYCDVKANKEVIFTEEQYKEVYFNEYCSQCYFSDKKEEDSPCDECLEEPVNLYSHKPVKFKKKIEKNGYYGY